MTIEGESRLRIAFAQHLWAELQGPLLLSEVLERVGHEVRFFVESRGWREKLAGWQPDVVAFSPTTGLHQKSLETAAQIRELMSSRPPLVVMGGPHATFRPGIVKHPAVDAVCRGEGEKAFPAFLRGIQGRRMPVDVPNFWMKQDGEIFRNEIGPLEQNLDALPIPSRRVYDPYPLLSRNPTRQVITGRGCPYECAYCHNSALKRLMKGGGGYLRRYGVEHVIHECLYLKEHYPTRVIEFVDDMFIIDKDWFLQFSRDYKRTIGLPYFAAVHPKFLDEDMAQSLKESGCKCVSFGVESGVESFRFKVMGKRVTDEQLLECARILKQKGLYFLTFNMVGFPGETLEMGLETVYLNQRLKPDYAYCFIAQPYPGTRLEEICVDQGLLPELENMGDPFPPSYFKSSIIPSPDSKALVNLQKVFSTLVAWPSLSRALVPLLDRAPVGALDPIFVLMHGLHLKKRRNLSMLRALRTYASVRKCI